MNKQCYIFGDESGNLSSDRFFALGILGTRNPEILVKALREIRIKTSFSGEVTYKSSDERKALCCIRWMDLFFSKDFDARFRVLIKDTKDFDVNYFKNNFYKAKQDQVAYCESYREVLNNFSDFGTDKKIFVYSQKSLGDMKVDNYLESKIYGLKKEDCYEDSPKSKKPFDDSYTQNAELLQLCDLLLGATRGLFNAICKEGENKSWVKKTLQLNLKYNVPSIVDYIKTKKSLYFPKFTPYESQKFVLYCWRPRNAKTPLAMGR